MTTQQAREMLRAPGGLPAEFRIDARGDWYYRGSVVRRREMVRLFAGMLRRHGPDHVLETPEQRIRVEVEDAPFVVVDSTVQTGDDNAVIVLRTNLDESFALDAEHPLLMRDDACGEKRPYQLVRDGLLALIGRHVYYRLVELAVCDPASGAMGIRSGGHFFALE